MKRLVLFVSMLAVTALSVFVVGEIVLRLFSPVEYLSPRYKYSPKYGFTLFENTRMVHGVPGRFKFHYTVNAYGYRGRPVELAATYAVPNIVVLGDSYSFGMGVADGEEYAAVLGRALDDRFHVINLGNPGWGLTQEIRRFYDFGSLFRPDIVILQFCSNDPEDNFNNMVTTVEQGDFRFHNNAGGINGVKKYLSRSVLQRSQLYNFFRGRGYELIKNLLVRRKEAKYDRSTSAPDSLSPQAGFYCELLERFATGLAADGVELWMISVNGQIERFPAIQKKALELDTNGVIRYIDVLPWFENVSDYQSKEGHVWGTKAHRMIALALADSILAR